MMNDPDTQRYLEEIHVVVQPRVATPEPDFRRRKRARCGTCSGCRNKDKNQDCHQCRNCLDQKRYGGPGRLKKACHKRQCAVVSQMIATETSPNQKPAVRSVPVHLTAHRLRRVKIEPQETAVTMAVKRPSSYKTAKT